MSANQVVLAASGGMGCASAGFRLAAQDVVHPLFVAYGQASVELEWRAVKALAAARKWKEPVRLELPHLSELSQLGTRFARERASGANSTIALLEDGAAPVLLEILLATAHWSYRKGISRVVCGLYRNGDSKNLNPDQLVPWQHDPRGFIHAANLMLAMTLPATATIDIDAPLADLTSAEVRRLAQRLQVPLPLTRSCHTSSDQPCGRCSSCRRHNMDSAVTPPESRAPALAS